MWAALPQKHSKDAHKWWTAFPSGEGEPLAVDEVGSLAPPPAHFHQRHPFNETYSGSVSPLNLVELILSVTVAYIPSKRLGILATVSEGVG